MVKSFANQVQGGWLNERLQSALNNASTDFNGASDPLYARRIEDSHKTEAERRAGEATGEGRRTSSKPEPVLKPESQRGRMRHAAPAPLGMSPPIQTSTHQSKTQTTKQDQGMSINQNNAWLAAHYWRAMNKAKQETPGTKPDRGVERQVNDRPRQSPSQSN